MGLPEFEFLEPTSVDEACTLLAESDGSAAFAGGTDVLIDLTEGRIVYRRLVSLRRIPDLERIEPTPGGGVIIGATATVNQVAAHAAVRERFPGIVDAALSLAADQVRNLATVAGNLCAAVPSADMAPILLAHDAALRVASPAGERTIPLRGFFTGPRSTVLAPGDVVVAVEVPPAPPGSGGASLRQGGRGSLSLAMAAVAATVVLEDGVCRAACVGLGAVAPTPRLAVEAGECLVGTRLGEADLATAGRAAVTAAQPIDDVRATRAYRLELVEVLTRRAVRAAAERAVQP